MARLGKHRTLGPDETMLGGGIGGFSLLAVPTQNDSQKPSPKPSAEEKSRMLMESVNNAQFVREVRAQLEGRPSMLSEENPLLQLYFEGDRIGAPAEGMGPAALTYEQLLQRQHQYPNGTDESDVVRCFMRFADNYALPFDYQAFAADWAQSITRQHKVATYGRTWKDLFATVKAFEAQPGARVNFNDLLKISCDRNSMGNGCLALVYPAYLYAREVGVEPVKLAQAITVVSHNHPVAQRCVAALATYFQTGNMGAFTPDCLPPDDVEKREHTPLAPGCLWAALECANEDSKENAVRRACAIGGDVDSFLSLGLLLWGYGCRR